MRREKSNRGGSRGNSEGDISHNDRQNVSSQRNRSLEGNNKKNKSLRESKLHTGLRGKSVEESDRSE